MMKIGQIETTGEPGRRDAFHVPAVLVIMSNQDRSVHRPLKPGQPVRFTDTTFSAVIPCRVADQPHGIVDPFLEAPARLNERFWVLLMPGMIKDKLTHQFDLNIEDVPAAEPEPSDDDDQCKGCW